MPEQSRIMAKFDDFEAFRRALGSLKAAGVERYEAYGPINLSEISDLMPDLPPVERGHGVVAFIRSLERLGVLVVGGRAGSPVRFHATAGAITGLVGFYGLCVVTSLIFRIIVGGKPPVANIPYVIPAYEGTILLGAIGAFFATIILARLLSFRRPTENYDPRFSSDRFGVDVSSVPDRAAEVEELLRNAGAVEINEY